MSKTKLLAQGGYGCVYHPGPKCNKKIDNNYVSKLMIDNKSSRNEYDISTIIRKNIENYKDFFIIMEKKCKVNYNLIDKIKKDCDIVKKKKKFIMMHSKYIDSYELIDYLDKINITDTFLIHLLSDILKRIIILYDNGIIHMDMHFRNILVSKMTNKLFVIDFGLALNKNNFYINQSLNMNYLKEFWSYYKTDVIYWPIEYCLLALLIKHDELLNIHNIMETIEDYYTNSIYSTFLKDKHTFIESTYDYFKKYEIMNKKKAIKELLTFSYSWDYYRIAVKLLVILIKQKMNDSNLQYLLLLMANPIPTLRPSFQEIKDIIEIYKE